MEYSTEELKQQQGLANPLRSEGMATDPEMALEALRTELEKLRSLPPPPPIGLETLAEQSDQIEDLKARNAVQLPESNPLAPPSPASLSSMFHACACSCPRPPAMRSIPTSAGARLCAPPQVRQSVSQSVNLRRCTSDRLVHWCTRKDG